MDGPGDEFLARTRFTGDEHGGVGGRHGLNLFEDAAQRRTSPHDLRETGFRCATCLYSAVSLRPSWSVNCSRWRPRFIACSTALSRSSSRNGFVKASRARLSWRGDRHRDVAMPGNENGGNLNLNLGQFLLQLQPAEAR